MSRRSAKSLRRLLIAAVVVSLFLPAAPASAARLVSLDLSSPFVDPAKEPLVSIPKGAPPRRAGRLRITVVLPNGYTSRRRYPVLYLLHGGIIMTPYSYLGLPQGRSFGDVRNLQFPGIIVTPDAGLAGFYTNWWNGGRRTDPGWERFHLDQVIPLIARRFSVRPGRRWHAIAGWSMGGYGATFYASQRPGYFGSAASLSGGNMLEPYGSATSAIWGSPTEQRFYFEGHDPAALAANLKYTRLYVTAGDGQPRDARERGDPGAIALEAGAAANARAFSRRARDAGAAVTLRIRRGVHTVAAGRDEIAGMFKRWRFFAPVANHPREWSYKTVAQRGDAWGYRFSFEKPPSEVITFRLRTRGLRAEGSGTVRIRTPSGVRFTADLPFGPR
jgi:S-formylglutathione hydrolase FrmB